MTIFDIPLKLAENLGLGSSEEQQKLTYDVREWERDATENNPDKLKALHAKIHKGVLLRVMLPFIYLAVMNWVKSVLNQDKKQDYLFDDED
tara:strand:- start:324 stop:596 length:273 start_codon:yes stop_codon:yes gene_type:complete